MNMPTGILHKLPTVEKLPLWQHQREAIGVCHLKWALHFDPGCGKSRTVIEILNRAPSIGWVGRSVVIFAPLNVCRNWQNELKEYCEYPFEIYLCAGQTKGKKLDVLFEFSSTRSHERLNILICNIEALRSEEYVKILKKSEADFFIIDEAHNFKTHNSKQTKGLLDLVRTLRPGFLYLLTGTPAPQGEIDLWTTFTLLERTKDTFFLWRKKHFEDRNERRRNYPGYWPDYQIRATSKILFQKILQDCSSVAKKSEVLDLPELLRTTLFTEMSKEQARHYETMREFLFAIDKEGNELNASNFLARTLRLQQILAGFLGDVPIQGNPRIGTLHDAIEKTAGAQFLVWTIFKATYGEIGKLLEKLEIPFGFLTGEQSAEERFEAMNKFQAGELRALIAHPKAGGVGVNLTAASYSIHYTRSFSLTDDLQAEARNHRGGSERHERITRIDIITPETLDEEIVTALRSKKTVQDFILGLKHNHKRMAA